MIEDDWDIYILAENWLFFNRDFQFKITDKCYRDNLGIHQFLRCKNDDIFLQFYTLNQNMKSDMGNCL